jgi:hypothetical protein
MLALRRNTGAEAISTAEATWYSDPAIMLFCYGPRNHEQSTLLTIPPCTTQRIAADSLSIDETRGSPSYCGSLNRSSLPIRASPRSTATGGCTVVFSRS